MIDALLATPGLSAVMQALPEARIVGGAVRDALLGRAVADIDLATPDDPETSTRLLQAAGLRVLPTGLAHGTVTALAPGQAFEITTLRRDVETDGRHAIVAWTADWREDAARRDFTINAMSLSRDGTLHDYFGGAADAQAGLVRFVGEAAQRVAEDTLRILRYFRFYARYGRGEPDAAALAAIRDGVPGLARLSAERVWSELKRILAAPKPQRALALMAVLGVLDAVLPEGADPACAIALIYGGAPADPLLRFAALLARGAVGAAGRLRLSNEETARLAAMRAPPAPPLGDETAWTRLLAETDNATLIARSWLAQGFGLEWDSARARLAAMPRPVFPLEGRDALALGHAPGPQIGEALRLVRARWLDAGCTGTREDWLVPLRRALDAGGASQGIGRVPLGPL